MNDNHIKKEKKQLNKKEIKNIAISGVAGGAAGAVKGAGDVAISNYKSYNKIKNAYINNHIDDCIKSGMSKKDAYKHLINEFSKKTIALNKVIPEYTGGKQHNVANAYQIKALSELPYKVIGGAMVGIPVGMLAYGQLSDIAEKINKKASDNMVYFEKVTNKIK